MDDRVNKKRAQGRFYTNGNPFELEPFKQWAKQVGLRNTRILEPFAGSNNLIKYLQSMKLCNKYASYDINPASDAVKKLDAISFFPKGYDVCITNPPWLSRNSAKKRKIMFPYKYDNIYKHCISIIAANCPFFAVLLPASYITTRMLFNRLESLILIHKDNVFADTENPVCLCLFNNESNEKINIYYDDEFIGDYYDLYRKNEFNKRNNLTVKFNDVGGNLGLISFDDVYKPSICFCSIKDIEKYKIKDSSRFITRISTRFYNKKIDLDIDELNNILNNYRSNTKDLFLTPFMGLRKDGMHRRRITYKTIRKIIRSINL